MAASELQAVRKFKSLTQNNFKKWVADVIDWVIKIDAHKKPLELYLNNCLNFISDCYIKNLFDDYKQYLNDILGDNWTDWERYHSNKYDLLCLEYDTKEKVITECFKYVFAELLDFVKGAQNEL